MLLEIEREEISMAEMLERLRNMVMSAGELNLRVFFERAKSRRELVLAFLSVLELVRTTKSDYFSAKRSATSSRVRQAEQMATNEETVNQELDEAALNEEASRELAAMVAEVEQSSTADEEEGADDALLSSPQSQAERAGGDRSADLCFG